MNKKIFIFYMFFIFLNSFTVSWKVLIYMDSTDGLSDIAFKNITEMMKGYPNKNVEILIQLHSNGEKASRYLVNLKNIEFISEVVLTNDPKADLIDAASWAFCNNKSDYTMLILWNHGWGALDPVWNSENNAWEVAELSSNDFNTPCTNNFNFSSKNESNNLNDLNNDYSKKRGFMFNAFASNYLNNENLMNSLRYIKEFILKKKIDIILFDTCMGSMLEIATMVAPSANYLLGTQSSTIKNGFDYNGLVATLNKGLNSKDISLELVKIFNNYYFNFDLTKSYTFAALDLSMIDKVNKSLNYVVTQLTGSPRFNSIIIEAHKKTPRFCNWPIYTDLISFFKLIEANLISRSFIFEKNFLLESIKGLYTDLSTLIISNCSGSAIKDYANGISIYMPKQKIDSSYLKSPFLESSLWLNLLEVICTE